MKVQSPITGIITSPENRFTRSVESVMLTAGFLIVGGYLAISGKISYEVFTGTLGGLAAVYGHAAHSSKRKSPPQDDNLESPVTLDDDPPNGNGSDTPSTPSIS